MFKNRSRSAIASVDVRIYNLDPFIVVIGGSDEYQSLNNCELYYPSTDTYYSFPSIQLRRENASICVMNTQEGIWIYVLGGFDKQAINAIERIQLEFDADYDVPVVISKWECLKDVTLMNSVECCGTFQLSDKEILIFGGLQKGEDENTQLLIFNTHSEAMLGINSHLKFTDCFFNAPVLKHEGDKEETP